MQPSEKSYRECPHCKESMRRDANICPHCRNESQPWIFHNGFWWWRTEDATYYLDERSGQWMKFDPQPSPGVAPTGAVSVLPQSAAIMSSPVYPYAGFWQRFGAAFIDGLILAIPFYGLGYLYGQATLDSFSTEDEIGAAIVAAQVMGLIGGWLYSALMECSSRQATLGKIAMNLIVTDDQGQRISFGKATGRYFAKLLSSLILLIGYIMAAFTPKKQALHDMLAGTLVLKKVD
jgi:uncharacterized RDD family membrane protein YckC